MGWITEHPLVNKISFTGSTQTGKAIQATTASSLKRLTLELGGNDAAIVLPDADTEAAAKGILAQAMSNSGQVCIAIKRAYVHESQKDEFVKVLTAEAEKLKFGDGFNEESQFGPLNNKMQFERVKELVEDAKQQPNAVIHTGGSPIPGNGYFYPPTIISGLKEGTRIVDEEQFGPVLPVVTYTDVDDVVKRANDSAYGLGGSVWGPTDKAAEVASQIDAGTVWVNSHFILSPDVPFGGRKQSGVGRQMGDSTIDSNTDKKILRIPKQKREFKMLVNGELVDSPNKFGVINPSTGQVFAQCPECSKEVLDQAVAAASAAQKSWAKTTHAERKKCLTDAIDKIEAMKEPLSSLLTQEQGKILAAAREEIGNCVHFLTSFADVEVKDKILVDNEKETVIEKHVPLGVVGGITPWNFPPLMAAWKIGEVVMTGNTIVIKPSPYTPLTTLLLGEAFKDTFPPGVVNFVSGSNEVGQWITEHPLVNKISFTGSTQTGKAIQAKTASSLKRLTLELGGNVAAIVLPDADTEAAAKGILAQAMSNSGQVCIAIKRAYVHESHKDEFVKVLTAEAEKLKFGDGFNEESQFGPLNNKMQFERVKELVEDAKQQPNAVIHTGGSPMPGNGYFYPPTIISGLKEGTRIVDEEQFGPVLPVVTYTDVDDVVKRANDSAYGLGGSVWGPADKAAEVASQIDAGTVWVNSHFILSPDVPFGGRKQSGVGRQTGDSTIDSNTDKKILRIPKQKKEFKMLVNGELLDSPNKFGVINPSTGQVFAQCPECSKEVLDQAVAAASAAQKGWAKTTHAERKKCLTDAIDKIEAMKEPLSSLLTQEQGKILAAAREEIGNCVHFLTSFADVEVKDKILVDNEKETVIEKHVPLGVVGGITPWNFPPLMAAWKIGEV